MNYDYYTNHLQPKFLQLRHTLNLPESSRHQFFLKATLEKHTVDNLGFRGSYHSIDCNVMTLYLLLRDKVVVFFVQTLLGIVNFQQKKNLLSFPL